jgi:hypothetical protein
MALVPTRAASSTGAPATSATAAEPAATIAPQPEASKPAPVTTDPSTASDSEIMSPHEAPPAAPMKAPAGTYPFPWGNSRCSVKPSALTRRV